MRCGAHFSVASHFGTFRLADDGQDERVEVLQEVLSRTDLRDTEFCTLGFGEGRELRVQSISLAEPKQIAR